MIWRALIALLLFGAPALAQIDCSGTVGATSAPVSFPSAGNHGPSRPTTYLTISNSAGTNKLAINPTGPAVIDSNGSFPMDAVGAGWTWSAASGYPPPASLNIVASSSATPYTCKYQ